MTYVKPAFPPPSAGSAPYTSVWQSHEIKCRDVAAFACLANHRSSCSPSGLGSKSNDKALQSAPKCWRACLPPSQALPQVQPQEACSVQRRSTTQPSTALNTSAGSAWPADRSQGPSQAPFPVRRRHLATAAWTAQDGEHKGGLRARVGWPCIGSLQVAQEVQVPAILHQVRLQGTGWRSQAATRRPSNNALSPALMGRCVERFSARGVCG